MKHNPLTLARFELRRFHTPLSRLALVFILVVPLLYGAIYLAGNWDPYGKVDRLPVAIVNTDQPVTVKGKQLAVGDDFVASLTKQATFKYSQTDAADAADGLRTGRYYMVITVPSDFSKNLASGQDLSPVRAHITLERNDANGFVIGSITNSAQNAITLAIDEAAIKSYFEAVFENLATIRSGMVQAAEGAAKLNSGAASASKGAADLDAGLATASTSSQTLAKGSQQLATGVGTASSGAAQLSAGLASLDSSTGKLAQGAGQVADGTQQLADTVDPVLDLAIEKLPNAQANVKQASSGIDAVAQTIAGGSGSISQNVSQANEQLATLLASHPELASDPAFVQLKAKLAAAQQRTGEASTSTAKVASDIAKANTAIQNTGDLTVKAKQAKAKVDALNSGAQQVATGATQLKAGTAQANTAGAQLASGLASAKTGADQVASGNAQLSAGLGKLSTGAHSLNTGLATLSGGANELASSLKAGAARVPVVSAQDGSKAAQVLSSPADVTMKVDNPAHFYGRGLAPLFFSIAIWVWGISAFMVMRAISGRMLAGRASSLRVALSAYLPTALIAVPASWLMLAVAWVGLDLQPVHPWLLITLVTVAALAFSAFAHFLRTALGLVATAALLVILIIQLSAAGGTYPAVILPGFFKAISPFMPMTYSIDAFRIAISGGLVPKFVRDLGVLLAMLVASGAGLYLVVRRKRTFALKDLHPPL